MVYKNKNQNKQVTIAHCCINSSASVLQLY